jgi:hypothetical protein
MVSVFAEYVAAWTCRQRARPIKKNCRGSLSKKLQPALVWMESEHAPPECWPRPADVYDRKLCFRVKMLGFAFHCAMHLSCMVAQIKSAITPAPVTEAWMPLAAVYSG